MSRYIQYTPTQNETTTLRFIDKGIYSSLTVRWFDTHVVAVTGDDAEFDMLLADQHTECQAVEIGFDAFFALAIESSQARFQIEQLDKQLADSINRINQGANQNEMMTWGKQEQEARALMADPASLTPMIDGLVISRGLSETREQLAGKIILAADYKTGLIAECLGEYQAQKRALFA